MADFCCQIRAKFLIGIVAQFNHVPMPVDAVDCIDFGDGSKPPVIYTRFCAFCGKPVTGPMRVAEIAE